MTPLGLDPASLRREVRQYRLRIRALIGFLESSARGPQAQQSADALVDELAAAVEIDVQSRSGAAGREHMSRLEALALVPMLEYLRHGIDELVTTPRPHDLLARLQELDDHVGTVEATLYRTTFRTPERAHSTGGSLAGS